MKLFICITFCTTRILNVAYLKQGVAWVLFCAMIIAPACKPGIGSVFPVP